MPSTCPRGCSRLVFGAVFMSVGVIQFLVGMILLRSKYVYLIAGPDFWTSVSNIAVGCLLGISASVWKQSRKYESKKHILRRRILLALLFSGLIINVTTLGILLIGKDDTLLSIRLESDDEERNGTFASEVLAYAYITSVCCPVVCVVVSIVAMSGSCFSSAKKNSLDKMPSFNSPKKNRLRSLKWIYNQDLSKTKYQEPVISTTSESSSEDDDNDDNLTLPSRYKNSTDDLHNVLSRMAQGKRDSILRDSTVMLRQLDLRRKNKYNSLNLNESYMGPVLSRVKEFAVPSEHNARSSVTGYIDNSRIGNSKLYSSETGENDHLPSRDRSAKHFYHSSDKPHSTQHRNAHERFIQNQTDSTAFVENPSMQYRNFRGKPHSRPKENDNVLGYSLDVSDYSPKRSAAAIHKKSRKIVDTEDQDFGDKFILKKSSHGQKKEFLKDYHVVNEKKIKKFNDGYKYEETSGVVDDCFSTDGSDFSPDGIELSRKNSSWAGEIVPIKIKSTSLPRFSCKLKPVPSPVVPSIQPERDNARISDDSGIASIQSISFSSDVPNQTEFKERENNLSSFRENPKKIKENMLEYPKPGSPSVKKYDLRKVVTMASISEEPNTEMNSFEQKAHSSFYETTPTKWKSAKQKSLPLELPGSSKQTELDKENSGINDTPRRKRSASGKALRKLWSLAGAENHIDFLDQVVDDDSLIGLSEEELIARQLRYRSIRKAVQQRLKGEMTVRIENSSEV